MCRKLSDQFIIPNLMDIEDPAEVNIEVVDHIVMELVDNNKKCPALRLER